METAPVPGPSFKRASLLSVVIPLFNEEAIIPGLCERLFAALRPLGCAFEIVVVDDGSSDRTRALLVERARLAPELRVVCLSRNFGLQGAVCAGLKQARGDCVVLLDGDLQDPPELIAKLYAEWQRGAEVVYTTKRTRQERGLKRLAIVAFHRLYRRLATLDVPLGVGNFSLIDRRALDAINALPEHNRYLPGLRSWVGFNQVEVPFDRHARAAGEPRMGWWKLTQLAVDGLFGFSYLPLRAATAVGLSACALGAVMVVWALYEKFVTQTATVAWPSLMIAVCLLGGAQLVGIGILGEYIARIYDEVRARPNFLVQEVLSFPAARQHVASEATSPSMLTVTAAPRV